MGAFSGCSEWAFSGCRERVFSGCVGRAFSGCGERAFSGCGEWAFSGCCERGLSLVAASGLSLVAGLIGDFDFLGKHYDANDIEIVYANDIDANACAIFEKNFGLTPDNRDIRTVTSEELPEFDILTGGFPCQSFSIVAQNPPRLGIKDDRGMLFFEMCRILRERQPKCFIAENASHHHNNELSQWFIHYFQKIRLTSVSLLTQKS